MQTARLMPALLGAALLIGTSAWASGTDEGTAGSGAAMAGDGQYQEAPMLAAMVAAGDLPPLEDRLPIEPKVLAPLEEVGTYGGTLNVFGTGAHPWVDGGDSPERSQYPLRMNFDGSIEPDQVKGYELAEDNMTFTMYLREGMKWSNGDPFTAEDFRFKHEMDMDEGISTWGYPEQLESITAVDDYTVRYNFRVPYPRVVLNMLHWRGSDWRAYAPSKWLKQWHIEYNADADAKAKEEGHADWTAAFNDHYTFCCPAKDINKPSCTRGSGRSRPRPYGSGSAIPTTTPSTPPDSNSPTSTASSARPSTSATYKLKVIAGEADYATSMSLDRLPRAQAERRGQGLHRDPDRGAWRVPTWPTPSAWTTSIRSSVSCTTTWISAAPCRWPSTARPLTRRCGWDRPCRDRRRRATTCASTSRSGVRRIPTPSYDPAEANRILDSIGLDRRNADGVRLLANGEPLHMVLTFGAPGDGDSAGGNPAVLTHELVKEYWEAVGASIQLSPLDGDSIRAAETAGEMDIRATSTSGIEFYDLRVRQQQPDGCRPPRCGPLLRLLVGREQRAQRRRAEHRRHRVAR